MKKVLFALIAMTAVGCSTTPKEQLHKDVKLGNESNHAMQCKILCDDEGKVYAFTNEGIKCQCQKPVVAEANPNVIRFELGPNANDTAYKGVMGAMSNGRTLMSVVPQGGE